MIFSPWFHVPYTEDYATVSITLDANGTFIHEVLPLLKRTLLFLIFFDLATSLTTRLDIVSEHFTTGTLHWGKESSPALTMLSTTITAIACRATNMQL